MDLTLRKSRHHHSMKEYPVNNSKPQVANRDVTIGRHGVTNQEQEGGYLTCLRI